MILPINNAAFVDRLIPLMQKVEEMEDAILPRYLSYMKMAIPQDAALLLVNIQDDNEIDSFIFAQIINAITCRKCFINLAYYNPNDKKIGREMEGLVTKWAESMGCDQISIITREERAKAYMKKYGFTDKVVHLSKPIGGKHEIMVSESVTQ